MLRLEKHYVLEKIKYLLIFSLLIFSSCKNSGDKFGSLDASLTDSTTTPITVKIASVTPATDPYNMASTSTTTFGVTLEASDSNVNYTFLLDNTTTLQSGTNPYYAISANTLTAGSHTLKVTASNASSSDQHTFNIIVNSPITVPSFTPTLTGTTLACGIGSQTISALYSEVDASDSVNIKWYLNNSQINFGNSTATVTNDPGNNTAMMNFHPDCTQTGINFIRLDLNDGHEITTYTWTVYVTAPITIAISDFTPTSDPTVLTNATSSTFGVTLATADSTANFQFVLDNSITVQNDHRGYYNLSGSALTTGNHTLKVTASNSNSSAIKTFNIRKNAPPTTVTFSPAFSGTSVNCGSAPITIYADMNDPNGDTLSYTWYLDDAPSAYLVPSNSGNRAQATLTPNCSISGTRVIKAVVSDGYDTTTLTWSIVVSSPITIQITSFLPATNPTIITAGQTTTFAIALSTSDSNVTYSFILKNLSTLVSNTLQTGAVPFYNLVGSSIAAGLYELKVLASNGSSSDSKTFIVRKNSPPSAPPTGFTYSPALTGTTLSCGSSSQVFQSDLSDADGDIMAITWSLDGNSSAGNLVSTSNQTLARATYTPTCAEVGIKTIKVDIYDGYETTSKTWTVQVINPTVVAINAYSPSTDPVNVLSTGAQTFTVSATGKAPLAYEWKLDGAVVSACTDTYCTITSSSLTTGSHTLVVKVSDSDSNQTRTFNIIKNSPPTLSNRTPSATTVKINVNTVVNFSANFADANGDTMTVAWKLNNTTVSAGNPNASVTTGSGLSTLTFSPSYSILGDNAIDLIVSDGKETSTYSWTVNVNYFSDTCNNMGAGRACTLLGQAGMGSNISVATNASRVRIQPDFIEPYGDAAGSYFFTDAVSHSVWFYNKSNVTVNILGQSIPAGYLRNVAGTGMNGVGTIGTYYNDYPFTNPKGLAWDNANGRLFVADDSNNRVVVIDNTGLVNLAFGGGANNTAGNTDGSLASVSYCQYPYGLAYSSAQNRLYVACYGSHTIKYVDTSNATIANWTASILVGALTSGASGAGSVDGLNGGTGAARMNAPTHIKFDAQNRHLYTVEAGNCRVRAIDTNNTTKTNYFFGAITLTANNTRTVVGSSCGTHTTGAYGSVIFNGGFRMGIELEMSGSTLNGIYVADYNVHRVTYINNSASAKAFAGTSVASYQAADIWNSAGTAGYFTPCSSASSNACYINNPASLAKINGKLFLTDYSNFRIRSFDTTVANGTVSDDLGYDQKAGYGGNGGTSTENVQFNTPLNLYYDSSANRLIVSDFYNYRIRQVNLTTGRVDAFIGNGAGNANNSNADPSTVGLRGPRGVTNYNGFYLYTDTHNTGSANANCVIRAMNPLTTTQTILGISTNANAIQTIIGSYINGCGLWNASATTGTNSLARLNEPTSVATDGSNVYFANTNDHCIVKVDQSGNMSTFSGLCGTAGAANAAGTAYSNTSIRFNFPIAVFTDPRTPYNSAGNLFILDQNTTAFSTGVKIRYINQYSSAVTIYGITINPGEIKTIYSASDSFGGDLAAFDNQICFSTGGAMLSYTSAQGTSNNNNNTVICFNRDDSTGTAFTRFGRNPSVYIGKGAVQHDQEDEGVAATSISLAGPSGLAFDANGNLYVAERNAHVIRKITRWW